MRPQRVHHHPCSQCGAAVECGGELERNFDGWPKVICSHYHRPGGELGPMTCEACAQIPDEPEDPACPRCGSVYWRYEGDRQICQDCGA